MVTVKRKVSSDTERYGGFSEIEVKTPEDVSIGDSFREAQYKTAEASFNYSAPVRVTADTKVERYNQDNSTSVPAPTPDEFMPKIRSESQETEPRTVRSAKQKMDSRTKLILGVYIAVILALSALVIATGIYLSSAEASVSDAESHLASQREFIDDQLMQIALLSDEDALAGRASDSGMEKVEETEEIDLLPIGDLPTYEGTTNWFDSFCDWLSGVFGG